ncbi:MAG: hypothetical protein ACTSO3_16295 [Candidatus Heimdallarchaeaceae archaeon]
MLKESEIEKELRRQTDRIKNGRMKLTTPIKSADEKNSIKEISVNESTDASLIYNLPMVQDVAGDFKDVIADITGLTDEQVATLNRSDYMTLVIYVGKL